MNRNKPKINVSKYLMERLEKNFSSATKKQLQNASKRMGEIARFLINIPLCESAAVGIGFSVKQSAEDIARDNNLDGDIVCKIIFDTVHVFSGNRSE